MWINVRIMFNWSQIYAFFLYQYTSDMVVAYAKEVELGKSVLNDFSLKAKNLFILY